VARAAGFGGSVAGVAGIGMVLGFGVDRGVLRRSKGVLVGPVAWDLGKL